jgi:hypothetical protein
MMPAATSDCQPFGLDVRRRKCLKIDLACENCRRCKVKCDGGRPGSSPFVDMRNMMLMYVACENSQKRLDLRGRCVYTPPTSSERLSGSLSIRAPSFPAKVTPESDVDRMQQSRISSSSDYIQQPQITPTSLSSLPSEPVLHYQYTTDLSFPSDPRNSYAELTPHTVSGSSISKHFGSSSNGTFTEQIKAAIDAKFGRCGLPPSPSAVLLVDALLFPLPLDEHNVDVAGGMEYELPSRKQADHLVNTYWSYVYPLFLVLSKS